jgi:hypothetical protein
MGIDASASLGYGIKISDKKFIEKVNFNDDEEDFEGKDFEFIIHGSDDFEEMCLCIKQSVVSIFCWDKSKSVKADKLSVASDWDEKLLSWAKKYNIKKPKIGWWLCSTMG